jgi:hypothetical protein
MALAVSLETQQRGSGSESCCGSHKWVKEVECLTFEEVDDDLEGRCAWMTYTRLQLRLDIRGEYPYIEVSFRKPTVSVTHYEERVLIEAQSDRSQRASLTLVNPTDAPRTGYCDVGVSSLDVTQLILVPRTIDGATALHMT